LKIKEKEPVVLKRSDAYIGVLIDDLVTKGVMEPYRILTSRAEYRLLLRQDNADLRLMDIGHQVGLISDERYKGFLKKRKNIEEEIKRLESAKINPTVHVNKNLENMNTAVLNTPSSLAELLKRPELNYERLKVLDEDRPDLSEDTIEQVEITVKYEGYIKRQIGQVEQFKKLENKRIPEDINYDEIYNLGFEAREKLKQVKPISIGQASRISGVNPSDITVLMIYLETKRRQKTNEQ
jgi:tRNA uridine 5-carboxymethylaminomethyl modification enzyme